MNTVVAWDIGGAHLKLARLEAQQFTHITQLATPMWLGPQHLEQAMQQLCPQLSARDHHCITFTAELVDYWPNRQTGLAALLDLVQHRLGDRWLRFYAGGHGLLDIEAARARPRAVMSANWHATAQVAAAQLAEGLLLDIGSTSSDLVPFARGRVQNRGYADQERLRLDELVYTGVIRSPVMSLCQRVPLAGSWQGLSNEHFATSADIHRITGELREADDMQQSANRGGKTQSDSLRRLARMAGTDYQAQGAERWALQGLAHYLSECQTRLLDDALLGILSRQPVGVDYTLVGAGCGTFLAERLARRHALPYVSFAELLQIPQVFEANRAASACALAWWARQELAGGH